MRYTLITICFGAVFGMVLNSAAAQSTDNSDFWDWHNLEEAQSQAESEQKKIFIFAEAEWCAYCKQMKREIFPQAKVQKLIEEHFYPVSIDIESNNAIVFNGNKMTEREFSREMRVSATPTIIFIDERGEVLGVQPGFIEEPVFISLLEYIGNNHMVEEDFEEFLERQGRQGAK